MTRLQPLVGYGADYLSELEYHAQQDARYAIVAGAILATTVGLALNTAVVGGVLAATTGWVTGNYGFMLVGLAVVGAVALSTIPVSRLYPRSRVIRASVIVVGAGVLMEGLLFLAEWQVVLVSSVAGLPVHPVVLAKPAVYSLFTYLVAVLTILILGLIDYVYRREATLAEAYLA